MTEARPTRRAVLRTFAGAAAGALGVGGSAAADPPGGFAGPIADTHFHLVNPRLLGVPDITAPDGETRLAPFDPIRQPGGAKLLAAAIDAEMAAAGADAALCMPRQEISDADPLGIKEIAAVAPLVRRAKLHPVGFAHPERYDRDHMARVEEVLKKGSVKALKAYLGYLRYGPDHRGYRPYYELAAKYKVPVVLHTGDNFSQKAKVKYAHPLAVDEVAVDFPDTRFVIAHFGNPWVLDAAQVAYKNDNVWVDLSGILIGNAQAFAEFRKTGVLGRAVKRIGEGIEFVERPEKFLFGSDWPLAPVAVYREFVRQLFPAEAHTAVFRENARTVFGV